MCILNIYIFWCICRLPFPSFTAFYLCSFWVRGDINPRFLSYTTWNSWVPQYIWGNSFVSDSAGSCNQILLENHVEHKAIKRREFFPLWWEMPPWCWFPHQNSEVVQMLAWAHPSREIRDSSRDHKFMTISMQSRHALVTPVTSVQAPQKCLTEPILFLLLITGKFQRPRYPNYTNVFILHPFIWGNSGCLNKYLIKPYLAQQGKYF